MPPLPRSLTVSPVPVLALLLGLAMAAAVPVPIASANEGTAVKTSGLPVPRFVTLRSNEVNVRTGPGSRYPIEWVFTRKDMPVEITQEFDTWRRIRDWEGSEGWVHQSMLSGRRGAVITGDVRTLREEPSQSAAVVARAKPGVIGALKKCLNGWCQLDIQGYRGWLAQGEFWGAYTNEKVD